MGLGGKQDQVSELERLWTECAEALRLQVSDATWRTWFASLSAVSLDSRRLVLAVPNSIVRERLESRYRELKIGDSPCEGERYGKKSSRNRSFDEWR